MKKSFPLIAVTCHFLLAGCASQNYTKMYEGPEESIDKVATFGVYAPGVMLKTVDGKSIDGFSTAGSIIKVFAKPGKHTVSLYTVKDAHWSLQGGGYKYALGNLEVNAIAGHTYTFSVSSTNELVVFKFEDKGLNFNPLCLEANNWIPYPNLPFMKKPDNVKCQ